VRPAAMPQAPPGVLGLPVVRASELPLAPPEKRWLIRELWACEGVGLIGGAPKSNKTWLGLEMAVSVASATPCLGRFERTERGRALLYMAEDAIPDVRARLDCLCRHRRIDLETLDIFVITSDELRIDLPADQQRLAATVAAVRPDLLLLDPLVRLHRQDENSSTDMSALLGFLRRLQRKLATAVILVHHARKNGSVGQPGQSLRGSSDLHAFGDSNLYLCRSRERVTLTVEHRSAPSPERLELALVASPNPHLEIVKASPAPSAELANQVLALLHDQPAPLTRASIRQRLQVKNERLGTTLEKLAAGGSVERSDRGWRLPANAPAPSLPPTTVPVPPYAQDRERNGPHPPTHQPDVMNGAPP